MLFYGIGPSYVVYDGNGVRIAPVVELVGWRVLSGFEAPPGTPSTDASGTNIVNLKFGARFNFKTQSSLYVGYGHALTSESWYDDIVRVEYPVHVLRHAGEQLAVACGHRRGKLSSFERLWVDTAMSGW